jgi:hypothetical protein
MIRCGTCHSIDSYQATLRRLKVYVAGLKDDRPLLQPGLPLKQKKDDYLDGCVKLHYFLLPKT